MEVGDIGLIALGPPPVSPFVLVNYISACHGVILWRLSGSETLPVHLFSDPVIYSGLVIF